MRPHLAQADRSAAKSPRMLRTAVRNRRGSLGRGGLRRLLALAASQVGTPLPRHADRRRALRSPAASAGAWGRPWRPRGSGWSLIRRHQLIVQVLSDDLAEDFAGVDIFQPDVGVDGGLHVAVAEELSDELVLARAGLENESACGVPELMYCDPQPGRLINPVCDL